MIDFKQLKIAPIRRGWTVSFELKDDTHRVYICCNWKQIQGLMENFVYCGMNPGPLPPHHFFMHGTILKCDIGCLLKTTDYRESLTDPKILKTACMSVEEAFEELEKFILFGQVPEQFYPEQLKENL